VSELKHRHELEVCSCGTVIYDCGCRLRLLYVREEACHGCRAAMLDIDRLGSGRC